MYLSTILPSAADALKSALVRGGLSATECEPGIFSVPFSSHRGEIWRSVFSGAFSPTEFDAIKCVVLPVGAVASPAELMQSESLASFLSWLEGQWLIGVLEGRRLMSVFQPIVHTDDPQNIYAYECLLRGRTVTGQWIMPDRLFGAAHQAGLLERLDSAARNAAVESAAQHRITTPVFVNIYPNAIQHFNSFLETTIAATQATGFPPHHFVFEFVESEEIADVASFLKTLECFRRRGFRVALDDVGAGYASLNVLVHVKPDFMKLDMGLIRDVDTDLYKSRVAAKLLELAQELQVKTVVEGIETVGEWEWSREHGADFAQGYLFARPDNPPPTSRFWGTQIPSETFINVQTVGQT
jgi:EAL domain-containing protein (putative c-di-GMP-specific phosphodiesterase class I)